ncbi:hypothetical protein RUND412_008155 [Rhizina undulata]
MESIPDFKTVDEQLKRKRVLIVGAGVAGLSLAVQMISYAGEFYEPILFEKGQPFDDVSKSGFAINLSPNATRVLKDLDFDLFKSGVGMPLNRTVLHHASKPTEILAQADDFFEDPKSLQTVERGPLQLVLLQRYLELGGQVHFGKCLKDIQYLRKGANTKVQIEFTAGEVFMGDFLVGADGVHSTVRRLLYTTLAGHGEDIPKPNRCPFSNVAPFKYLSPVVSAVRRYLCKNGREERPWEATPSPWTALYGITKPLSNELLSGGELGENGMGTMHWYLRDVPGAYSTYSTQRGRVFWICYQSDPISRERDSAISWKGELDAVKGDAKDLKLMAIPREKFTDSEAEEERQRYGDQLYCPKIPVTASSEPVEFRKLTETSDRIMKVRLWHTVFKKISNEEKNIILIGDAAHPMTAFHGQGGGMGVEEGLVLCNAFLRLAWKERGHPRELTDENGETLAIAEEEVGIRWFEAQRAERSQRVTDLGWWFGFAVMGDWGWWRLFRDVVLKLVLPKVSSKPGGFGEVAKRNAVGNDASVQEKAVKGVEGNPPEHWLFDLKLKVEKEEDFWKQVGNSGQSTLYR